MLIGAIVTLCCLPFAFVWLIGGGPIGIVLAVGITLGPLALVISGIWRTTGAWRIQKRNRDVMQLASIAST